MSRKEIVFAKQCALTTKDWDTFQLIIRRCLRRETLPQKHRPAPPPKSSLLTVLLLLIQVLLVSPAAQAAGGGEAALQTKSAIVVASFGTTVPQALTATTNVLETVRRAFPETEVRLAFTSHMIRTIWQERSGDKEAWFARGVPEEIFSVRNIITTLGQLQEEGYDMVIVQPTHMFFMEQSHDLLQYVRAFDGIETIKERWRPFKKIVMGRPALGMPGDRYPYQDDITAAATALAADVQLARERQAALLYMGHGNEHWSTDIYRETQRELRRLYPDVATFIGVAEGSPALEDILGPLKAAGTSTVIIKPFMLVAGDHAVNDMAGEQADSWKSRLEAAGFDVEPVMIGLGSNESFAALFVEHIKDAARQAGISLK